MRQVSLFLFLIFFNTYFSQEKAILSIDNEQVLKSEFEQIYWKNKKEKIATKEDLDEYIQLFVNFKLKVKAAEELGLDTTKKFKDELIGYRVQLEKPYLIDTSINEELINEAYFRTINEVNASHIMIKLGPNPSGNDTMAAYKKIESIRAKINSGDVSFEDLAEEVSEDPSAKFNKGNLGFFNAFKMLYSFECAAYETPIGKVSKPIRTRYGYHLVKPNVMRKAIGKMRTSHIMITTSPRVKDNEASETKINSIYQELESNNKTFEELAVEYSEDRKSAKKGGEIGWISSAGNFYPEFEKTVFSLKEDGEYSQPFKTPNGWHIVKRLEFEKVGDLNDLKYELKNKIQKDSRAQKTKSSFINQLKGEYNLKENFNAKILLSIIKKKNINEANISDFKEFKELKNNILSFSEINYSSWDFLNYLSGTKMLDKCKNDVELLNDLNKRFINYKLIEYEKTQLERKHPDFKALMKEYRDGILLFEISDQNIWTKAIKDTSGLKEFFNSNRNTWEYPNRVNATIFSSSSKKTIKKAYSIKKKGNINNDSILMILNKENPLNISFENKIIEDLKAYNYSYENLEKGINNLTLVNNKWFFIYVKEKLDKRPKELKEAEGIIVSAYQNYLEESWIKNLKKKYAIKIDYDTLYSIKEKP
tara:strand:+ start:1125 stop:3071 length:1947 start_codon:yes stop_codon:yes gene_type:complete